MKKYFVILLLVSFPDLLFAQLIGRVVGVADGDTFTMLTEELKQIKIRLHGIDCPEKKQAFGQVAKSFTSKLIFDQVVKVASSVKYNSTPSPGEIEVAEVTPT